VSKSLSSLKTPLPTFMPWGNLRIDNFLRWREILGWILIEKQCKKILDRNASS